MPNNNTGIVFHEMPEEGTSVFLSVDLRGVKKKKEKLHSPHRFDSKKFLRNDSSWARLLARSLK